ncbi:PD40 domain-containing protein [Candidatus Poribacteria bacterium]|nr:PD40 domain-containing protein [Candidatus Poribacteria bacterium]
MGKDLLTSIITVLFMVHPSPGEEYKILYLSMPRGMTSSHIYLMNPDGSETKRIKEGGAACWSPDGKRIAFLSIDEGPANDIFVMNVNGTDLRNITRTPNEWESDPDWSPNGREILFSTHKGALWAIDVETGQRRRISPQHRIVNGIREFQDSKARWSSDGGRIVFLSVEMGRNFDIYMCDSDGGSRVNLTNSPSIDDWPTFTPDGRGVVFVSNRGGKLNNKLYLLDLETRKLKLLCEMKWGIQSPDVSPDGRWIVFSSGNDREGVPPSWELYVFDMLTKKVRKLTDTLDVSECFPRWSPVPIGMGVSPSGKLLTLWGMLKVGFRIPKERR